MKKLDENKTYINGNTGTVKTGKEWSNDCFDHGENSELWGMRDPEYWLEEVENESI